jgi:DNA repair protein RecN (Recombination protein N)
VLEEIRIHDLGVIDDAVLELSPGLTVVTGETGAGKTMVVQGLTLLLGGRADAGLVRPGASRAAVEGRLRLAAGGVVAARAADAGADLDPVELPDARAAASGPVDDAAVSSPAGSVELIVSRTVSAEGRSRAHLGGRGVPVGLLAELADLLVAVHGQSDQHRLLRPSVQRAALDALAGQPVAGPLAAYAAGYARHAEVVAALSELRATARARAQEADLLRFGLDEVAAAAPQPDEDTRLAAELDRLGHADALRAAAVAAQLALTGDADAVDGADALSLVTAARRALDPVTAIDPALADLAQRVAEAGYLLADAAADLAAYADGVDADPARLAAAHERRAVLAGLTRKYGADVGEVLRWADDAQLRLAELTGDDDRIEALDTERGQLRATLAELADQISRARRSTVATFAGAVTAELTALAMPHAEVSVSVTQRDDPDGLPVGDRRLAFGPHGVDDVEILLVPHPGAPPRPLGKGASGGELSRVMLATEVVLAGADPVPTFVFDEVDAGVGGRAAIEIGRRLARLARTSQVIVVTHLPQVAAFADRHLVVRKTDDGRVTSSGVVSVDGDERVRELSRMLAGVESSALARGHADELLAIAAAERAAPDGARPAPAATVPADTERAQPAKPADGASPTKGGAGRSSRRRAAVA